MMARRCLQLIATVPLILAAARPLYHVIYSESTEDLHHEFSGADHSLMLACFGDLSFQPALLRFLSNLLSI